MENFCPKCGSKEKGNIYCSNCGNHLLKDKPLKKIKEIDNSKKEINISENVNLKEIDILNKILAGDKEEAKKRRIIEKRIGEKLQNKEVGKVLGLVILWVLGPFILLFLLIFLFN